MLIHFEVQRISKQRVLGLPKDLPSFDKVVPPSFFELGLAELVSIYNELCENGKRPPVIDASELQKDPNGF
ncbi:branched-chain-amino-acid aminotransferase-like protein, putative [Medicago truncatula]|uniref:Branched-chain-amino-acid aminotransferase-like protein, putative n=1 Tax=Medicago truncatula TaxID=3880 RepID=G7LDN2_MEDTR|nr:branched-chain-amino-acid aminotransferase-like protein, putative [Medicago truncatula]